MWFFHINFLFSFLKMASAFFINSCPVLFSLINILVIFDLSQRPNQKRNRPKPNKQTSYIPTECILFYSSSLLKRVYKFVGFEKRDNFSEKEHTHTQLPIVKETVKEKSVEQRQFEIVLKKKTNQILDLWRVAETHTDWRVTKCVSIVVRCGREIKTIMLQPRILVGSHRTDPQTTKFKIRKFKNSVANNSHIGVQRCTDATSSLTKTNNTSMPTKMWSHNDSFKCMRATATTEHDDNNSMGANQRRRRHSNHKSAVWSPAINITSSIHNLATFLILAITLYSTTLCMAQLSGKYFPPSHFLYHLK